MRQEALFNPKSNLPWQWDPERRSKRPDAAPGRLSGVHAGGLPRQAIIGLILAVALLAFEIFNFDTTRFALADLLGEASFLRLRWATILAVAFCAIDFAGLAYLFTPGQDDAPHREVWYLMGAWLLGATMNALMTWWAVSLTLLNHQLGNEVMAREQLLQIVPIFVAVLVWLTRILFIGAFSVAGNALFGRDAAATERAATAPRAAQATARPDDSGQAARQRPDATPPKRANYGPPRGGTFRRQPAAAVARPRRR